MKKYRLLLLALLLLSALVACRGTLEVGVEEMPTPTAAVAPTATVAVPTPTPAPTQPPQIEIFVYFTDSNRYAAATPPFEVAVTRYVAPTSNLPEAVLTEFFKGPTEEEHAQGLDLISSGFTGFTSLRIEDGVAHVYLTGPCASGGATYTIAQPLLANLLPFGEIDFVKIYDAEGETEEPTGQSNSIPFCLEP